ncbi:MAG: putative lipid II flippase FtsW [bacterium]|nr:putative lipid II flippase FtsW [bacterium]
MQRRPDYVLITLTASLLVMGLIILSSASVAISHNQYGSTSRLILNQLFPGVVVGCLGFFFSWRIVPYTFWRKVSLPLLLGTLILLGAVFTDQFGFSAGGARRWIHFKFIFFQPSELAKLAIIVYLAAFFAKFKDNLENFWQTVFPFMLVSAAILGFIALEPDIGTLGVLTMIIGALFFVAGGAWKYISYFIGGGIALFFILIKTTPYRFDRFLVFLHPELDPKGIGYQIQQALLAIGSGGLWGLGLGESRQKYSFLPESVGDSIFAIAAEELGFIGATVLVLLFMFFVLRAFRIAYRAPDLFGRYLAVGIASWIAFQAFINMSAITGLIPLTGITLPFVSYGGSSLALVLTSCGILVNISKYAKS